MSAPIPNSFPTQPNAMERSKPPRLRLSPEKRITQILDAAASEFARCGFQQARVEDIAAASGLSKGGFYAHFQSKDAVFEALLARDLSGDSVDLLTQFATLPAMSVIIDGVAEQLTHGLGQARTAITFRLLLADGWRVPAVVQCWREQHVKHIEAQLQTLLQRCVQAGICQHSIVVDCPSLLLSSIVQALVSQMIDPQHSTLDEMTIRNTLRQLLCELLLPSTRPPQNPGASV